MTMIIHTLETLFPVFAVIGIGYILSHRKFLSKGFLDDLNKLVYWVSLPALIVTNLDRAQDLTEGTLTVILVYFATTLIIMGVAAVVAKLLRLKKWQWGTFMQGSFRGNLAFIGIPILMYAMRNEPEAVTTALLAKAVFIFAPIMIFYNATSVMVLVGSHQGMGFKAIPRTMKSILLNPLILAAMLGLVLYILPYNLPGLMGETLTFVGRTAAPMALICVGGGMALSSMEGRYRSATFSAFLKVGATPLVAYLCSLPFGLDKMDTLILMIFAATPTAISSYVMAKELHGDPAMASGGIVLSTALSVLPLAIVVSLF